MENQRILFYTFTPRLFRATLVGHLFSICQRYPVTLLSEVLDVQTEQALANRHWFPFLEKVVPVNQFTGIGSKNIFSRNAHLCTLARRVVDQEKPRVVVTASDMNSLFDLYLIRFAKKAGATVVCFQPGVDADSADTARWVERTGIARRFPWRIPFWVKLFLERLRKRAGHIWTHWVLPLSAGQMPFAGSSSFTLWKGISGMRGADYQVVLSQRDAAIYRRAGVDPKKLKLLPHPLAVPHVRDFFRQAFFDLRKDAGRHLALVLVPVPDGLRKQDWLPIPPQERRAAWGGIIAAVRKLLPDWEVVVSAHPDAGDISELARGAALVRGPVDRYVQIADAIIGLPRMASTVLFTAVLQRPGLPIAAVDFEQEVLGDFYRGFPGICYISQPEELTAFLKNAAAGRFQKNENHATMANREAADLLGEIMRGHA